MHGISGAIRLGRSSLGDNLRKENETRNRQSALLHCDCRPVRICHSKMVMVLFYGMKQITVPIDQAGRIVLPKNVREELAIKPGDTFKLSIHGSSVSLTPNKETTGLVRKGHALVFATVSGAILPQDAVQKALDEIREERYGQILARLKVPKRKA